MTTDSMRDEITALGCQSGKIAKHYPAGIDLANFAFQSRTASYGKPIILLTVARLVEKKGIAYALHAVARIAQHHPNLKYWVVGDGPLRESLGHLVSELGLSETVQMFGAKTDVEILQLLSKADLFLLPSITASDGDQDCSPIVLLEAQAAGVPVLSTIHCGIPEIVLDGESGYLVPERNVEALVTKIRYLIDRPQTWQEMGRNGRRFVERHFSSARLGDRLVEIYQGLLTDDVTAAT